MITLVATQDDFGGGDDAGGADLDMDSMLGPPGDNSKSSDGTGAKPTIKIKTILEESISAMQQLGFIIGETEERFSKNKKTERSEFFPFHVFNFQEAVQQRLI